MTIIKQTSIKYEDSLDDNYDTLGFWSRLESNKLPLSQLNALGVRMNKDMKEKAKYLTNISIVEVFYTFFKIRNLRQLACLILYC